jgi:hypothetical protein
VVQELGRGSTLIAPADEEYRIFEFIGADARFQKQVNRLTLVHIFGPWKRAGVPASP